MPTQQFMFDSGDLCVVGRDGYGKEVYRWADSNFFAREKKLAEIEAMTPQQRLYMVLEYKAQQVQEQAQRDMDYIQSEADKKIAEIKRNALFRFDDLLNHAMEEDKEFSDFLIAGERIENFALESRKALAGEFYDPRWPNWNGEGEPPENDLGNS